MVILYIMNPHDTMVVVPEATKIPNPPCVNREHVFKFSDKYNNSDDIPNAIKVEGYKAIPVVSARKCEPNGGKKKRKSKKKTTKKKKKQTKRKKSLKKRRRKTKRRTRK